MGAVDPTTYALAVFFREAMDCCWEGNDLDGADIQDAAERLKLIVKVKYDPALHGTNNVDAEIGDDWFVLAPDIQALLGLPSTPPTTEHGEG